MRPGKPELVASVVLGIVFGSLPILADSGAAYLGLVLATLVGVPICAALGLISGRLRGIVTPTGRLFDHTTYMLSLTLTMWVVATATTGWIGWIFGLAAFVVATAPALFPKRNLDAESNGAA